MATKPLKIAAQVIFLGRQINLKTQNFKIIPPDEKKCKVNMMRYLYDSVYKIMRVVDENPGEPMAVVLNSVGYGFFKFFMPRHQKVAGYYVIPSEILSVRPSVCLSVCPSVRPSVSAHHHSCIGNSSYSFRPILLKLYRCFKDGLKICILFFQNPEIIFYHFFPIFNLDIFRALILQICIWSMYLVSATPPTVFGESF